MFCTTTFPTYLNETYITLIPNVKAPKHITEYRLIGLCNTLYKLITKILVGLIRPHLSSLINHAQSSFNLKCVAVDNAISIQETLHLFRKENCRTGEMMIKINIEKAFDRLE